MGGRPGSVVVCGATNLRAMSHFKHTSSLFDSSVLKDPPPSALPTWAHPSHICILPSFCPLPPLCPPPPLCLPPPSALVPLGPSSI